MKVILRDHTVDPEYKIGREAAECYAAKTDRESCIRRALHCKDVGHLAVMRFGYATFHISGISRICSHQIVRLAHAGILQRSQRYVAETAVYFIQPPALDAMPDEIRLRWAKLEQDSRDVYCDALAAGMKKEDARYALLHSAETSLSMCLNFQAWQDFLRNRTSKAAQWEIRDVAREIQRLLSGIAPGLFP